MNPLHNIRIVLVAPGTPGNIGAVARVMKTTGMRHLVLVNPGAWDTPEARWMAHGSGDVLDSCEVVDDLATAVAPAHIVVGTTHRLGRFRDVNSEPRQAIAALAPHAYHHQIALVFGREKDGLWRSELRHCHQLLRFPSAVSFPSLNLSQAVLLFAYEFFHALQEARPAPPSDLATAVEREHLYRHLGEALEAIEFRPYNDDSTNFGRTVRRVFSRILLERRDVMVVHKICRQIERFASRHRFPEPPGSADRQD